VGVVQAPRVGATRAADGAARAGCLAANIVGLPAARARVVIVAAMVAAIVVALGVLAVVVVVLMVAVMDAARRLMEGLSAGERRRLVEGLSPSEGRRATL
jgi:hypothetical protein